MFLLVLFIRKPVNKLKAVLRVLEEHVEKLIVERQMLSLVFDHEDDHDDFEEGGDFDDEPDSYEQEVFLDFDNSSSVYTCPIAGVLKAMFGSELEIDDPGWIELDAMASNPAEGMIRFEDGATQRAPCAVHSGCVYHLESGDDEWEHGSNEKSDSWSEEEWELWVPSSSDDSQPWPRGIVENQSPWPTEVLSVKPIVAPNRAQRRAHIRATNRK